MGQELEPNKMIDHYENRYSVGILAEGNCVSCGCEEAYLDYLRFRASVYVFQTRMLSPELILADGTERDDDDSRSVHIGVFEEHRDSKRVIAALRIIRKTSSFTNLLPIEKYFPSAFASTPIPYNNIELSRYICAHENKGIQRFLTWPLLSVALSYMMKHNIKVTYAIIEPPLERILNARGLPVERLADPEFLPHYNGINIPVIINNKSCTEIIEARTPGIINTLSKTNGQFVNFEIYNKKGEYHEND